MPIGARADAEFCSNACRQRDYRARQKIRREAAERYGTDDPAAILAAIAADFARRVTDPPGQEP
jgi:hypothetical protein